MQTLPYFVLPHVTAPGSLIEDEWALLQGAFIIFTVVIAIQCVMTLY